MPTFSPIAHHQISPSLNKGGLLSAVCSFSFNPIHSKNLFITNKFYHEKENLVCRSNGDFREMSGARNELTSRLFEIRLCEEIDPHGKKTALSYKLSYTTPTQSEFKGVCCSNRSLSERDIYTCTLWFSEEKRREYKATSTVFPAEKTKMMRVLHLRRATFVALFCAPSGTKLEPFWS